MTCFVASAGSGRWPILRRPLSVRYILGCAYTPAPATALSPVSATASTPAACVSWFAEGPPASIYSGRRFLGAASDRRDTFNDTPEDCTSSSSSSSVESRVAEVEIQVKRLQGIVEDHERHLKEFVIEKVLQRAAGYAAATAASSRASSICFHFCRSMFCCFGCLPCSG